MGNKINKLIKKSLLFIGIVFLFVQQVSAQNGNLYLSQIIDLVECTKISSFDLKARKLGFTYESVNNKNEYAYIKTISSDGYDLSMRLYYYDKGNNKQLIAFATSAAISVNYCSEIKSQAKRLDFTEAYNSPETDELRTTFLFSNETYKLEIHDTKRKGRLNSYIIGVSYLSPETIAEEKAKKITDAVSAEKITDAVTAEKGAIGQQVWATENLNTDRFRNGDLIAEAETAEAWQQAAKNGQPAWCYYDGKTQFGKLYNWYAVNDPRGLSPKGWHIPTKAEVETLVNFLGGKEEAAKKMKTTNLWITESGNNNSSGFSAMPGGSRNSEGKFWNAYHVGEFWTSSLSSNEIRPVIKMSMGTGPLGYYLAFFGEGCYVRCIKN